MIARFLFPREFTGYHMLAILVLFFGTIISVNLTLAWFANSTWTGLVIRNGYVASQEFDQKTRELERQLAKGWQASVTYAQRTVTVELTDKAGNPLMVDSLIAEIGHPVTETWDRSIDLLPSAKAGTYSGETTLGNGLWEVLLKADSKRLGPWSRRIRFTVRG
jgi:nitrogen fixation protein FixH